MRKPRDFDAELKALAEKAKMLRETKTRQLGELVAATGADALDIEILAGGLLAFAEGDEQRKDEWRERGALFFQGKPKRKPRSAESNSESDIQNDSGAASA